MKIVIRIVILGLATVGLISVATALVGRASVITHARQPQRFQLIGSTSQNPGEPFLIKDTKTPACWLAVRNGSEGIAVAVAPADVCAAN